MEFTVRGTPVRLTKGTVIVVLVCLAGITYGGYDYVQQSEAVEDAVPVQATIQEASVSHSESRGASDYYVQVEFTYQFQGEEYTGDQLFPGSFSRSYDTRSDAQAAIESYDVGETVTGYVDPATPSEGFLERQAITSPFEFVALGGVVLLLTTLNAIGARKPGAETGLRTGQKHASGRYETLFGVERDRVHGLSTRLLKIAILVIPASMVGVAGVLLVTGAGSGSPVNVQVGLTDPVGLLLGIFLLAVTTLFVSMVLYSVWSFSEYRRLRERIPEPRPPSPFKHPTRLVTICIGNYELDAYGKRIQKTGFAFLVVFFVVGALAQMVLF
ncbi:DUF3592 domain-containing protein [Halorientalis litorea]|uniref:DUF3592 domain-containing protein n=1 Tax=Halorientalis litorea TaxID=2931977 RepID=UPI001FF4D67A|nr:DUF3592 domain-containing protein [Halorientalis litorea]